MARNSIRYIVILLALSMTLGSLAWASVETTVPETNAAPAAKSPDESGSDDESDDESDDDKTVEDQAGFNTLEDMLLFRGPLATLWAAPQPVTASVKWREVAPEDRPDSDGDKSKE
jgi:hypothetical protein